MKRQSRGLYAVALAILVVGLVALGVPASTLLFAAFLLVCPLMMMFMMGGMHGGHSGHGGPGDHGAAGPDRDSANPASERHNDHHGHTSTAGRQ